MVIIATGIAYVERPSLQSGSKMSPLLCLGGGQGGGAWLVGDMVHEGKLAMTTHVLLFLQLGSVCLLLCFFIGRE